MPARSSGQLTPNYFATSARRPLPTLAQQRVRAVGRTVMDLDRVADILERSLYGEADFQHRLSAGGNPIRGLRNSVIFKMGNVLIFKAKASVDTDGRVDPGTDPNHLPE